MTIDLKLTNGWDLTFENNDFQLVEDSVEVAQNVKIRLLTIESEWVYDYTIGVPWFDFMFATSSTLEEKEQYLKEAIIDTTGILEITDFVFGVDPINKGALVTFSATVDGGENIQVEVVSP